MARTNSVSFVTRIAVLTALAVLVRRILTPQVAGLNLGGFPLVISGLLLGPIGGAYVGGLSDVIGVYLAPRGAFNPFFTLTAMLTASVPALVISRRHRTSFWALVGGILTGQLLTKALLFPLYFHITTNVPIGPMIAWNTGVQLLHAPLYALLARAVLRALPFSVSPYTSHQRLERAHQTAGQGTRPPVAHTAIVDPGYGHDCARRAGDEDLRCLVQRAQ